MGPAYGEAARAERPIGTLKGTMSHGTDRRNFLRATLLTLTMAIQKSKAQPAKKAATSSKPAGGRQAPVAAVRPTRLQMHGETRIDPYFWLREKKKREVIAYLEAENAYTERQLGTTKRLQKELYTEMVARMKETDLSYPVRDRDYLYYARTEKGKNYRIYCRRRGSMESPEEILLDCNLLAKGHQYFSLGAYEPSPNQQVLAYSTDVVGDENYTVFFKDLPSGKLLPDRLEKTDAELVWGNDNATVFFVTRDEALRPYRLWRYVLGSGQEPELLHEEKDEKFTVQVEKSRDDRYIFLALGSTLTNEYWFLPADRPKGKFKVVAKRRQGVEYDCGHYDGNFLIRTNWQAKNFRLMKAPVAKPGADHWEEFIPHRPEVSLEGFVEFAKYLVLEERTEGLSKLRIVQWEHDWQQGEGGHHLATPEPVYNVDATPEPAFDSQVLRYRYTSLITPNSLFDYDMETREQKLLKREEVLGGYKPSNYRCERLWATAKDGTKVPMAMVYRKGAKRKGGAPCLLYGYGSYGINMEPSFSSNRVSLLDRGVIYVLANIRGGSEMGRQWYDDGKFLKKKNTFTDFIACAEHLVANKITSPQQLAIQGGSAGGLLMGATLNLRPDLFQAAIASVPFVDVLTTMLDASLPLTVGEYEEWGNPNDQTYYEYIRSYSPYDNVQRASYPHLLVTAGLNDPRVSYWEPAKWVAKLRTMNTSKNMLLLKTNMGAGHFGQSGRYDYLKEIAMQYAFLLKALGIMQR